MAAPAVQEQHGIEQSHLRLVVDEDSYRLADAIPAVAQQRQAARQYAESILQRRSNHSAQAELPPPVDPLSTAHKVLQATSTEQKSERYKGLQLDCQRLVAEWYRKTKSEYFPPSRHEFDEHTQEFYSHGLSIRQMTENALLPMQDNREEEARRINEHVEDATPQILRSLGQIALGQEVIRTISECSDTAIAAYEQDQAEGHAYQGYFGYVPEIQKVMIRDIRLDAASNDRFEEQVGLPGTYITHDIITMALERAGVEAAHMDKTQLHGAQIIARDGLLEFVARLDDVASEQWCTNIFMGEEVPKDYVKNYAAFRDEALQRQSGLSDVADKVAMFVLHLAEEGTSTKDALTLVEDFVKLELFEIGKKDLSVVEQMFGAESAGKLYQAAAADYAGNITQAEQLRQEAFAVARGGGFCGAGSCGLTKFTESGSASERIKEGLKTSIGDTLTKDNVRSCKSCGQKKLYYAHTTSKVHTYCDGCGASRQSKQTVAASQTAAA